MTPRPHNRKRRLSDRNAAIYTAVCEGTLPLVVIAQQHGISKTRVIQICDAIDIRMAVELAASVGRIKGRQTGQLQALYRKALKAWDRSCGDAESTKTIVGGAGGNPPVDRIERTVKGQAGDPRFLQLMRDLLADERAIWGANAPVKREIDKRVTFTNPVQRLKAANDRMSRLLGEDN